MQPQTMAKNNKKDLLDSRQCTFIVLKKLFFQITAHAVHDIVLPKIGNLIDMSCNGAVLKAQCYAEYAKPVIPIEDYYY